MSADDRRRPRGLLKLVWSPQDFDDLERHAAEAIELTKAIAYHPATVSKQYEQARQAIRDNFDQDCVFNVCRRAEVGDPAAAPEQPTPAPVVDLFTRQRVK